MTAADWKVEVRDRELRKVGELDTYQKLEMKLRYNDISTWTLSMDRRDRLAPALCQPGAGIIVRRNGIIMLTGYVLEDAHDLSSDRAVLTLSGADDTIWLAGRNAHPQPTSTAPPYSTQAQDTRTGVCSTIMRQFVGFNAGTLAVAARQVPTLTNGADPVAGASVTGSARWQTLLALIQELGTSSEAAGAPVGFYIRQSGGAALAFFTYAPTDLSASIRFSLEHGNLAQFSYRHSRPGSTYAVVGGTGEGVARTFFERPNSAAYAEWGRFETLVDGRNAITATELGQAADKELADNGEKLSMSLTPTDREGQQFGIDYNLGSKVTVVLPPVGPPDAETVTATALGQGASVTGGYLIALEAAALPFPTGTRVRLFRATGTLKESGTRVVTGRTTAFGYTNIDFFPPASVGTVAGDYLEAFVSAVPPSVEIKDIVREVTITLDERGVSIVPSVGTDGARQNPSHIIALVKKLAARVVNIERR